jgi:hypothetical protein
MFVTYDNLPIKGSAFRVSLVGEVGYAAAATSQLLGPDKTPLGARLAGRAAGDETVSASSLSHPHHLMVWLPPRSLFSSTLPLPPSSTSTLAASLSQTRLSFAPSLSVTLTLSLSLRYYTWSWLTMPG